MRITLPSGKEMTRAVDGEGRVVMEVHAYGEDICLVRRTRPDEPAQEEYMAHGFRVDRGTYELARLSYPDMPAADPDVRDGWGESLRRVNALEKVRQLHAQLPHRPTQPGQRLTYREREELPSGKSIIRSYCAGRLAQEMHSRGDVTLKVEINVTDGKRSEIYLSRDRVVSRKTYERDRQRYPDMPPASATADDASGALLRDVRAERRHLAKSAKQHLADPEAARKLDAFCRERMQTGRCADAIEWVRADGRTLGERTQAESRRLVAKLAKLGAVAIYACEIASSDDGRENTGHLVVELPPASAARAALLKEVTRLARVQGYQGDLDDGQRYSYVKLD